MLSPVSRSGAPRFCFALCFAFLLVLANVFTPAAAEPFTARGVGDFNQIAVIEVTGNFDALDSFGQINSEPRRALAREFYRSHGDDYDFLVYFTNFDVRMPTLQAKAFFSPARNNVQGIGLPLYDHTGAYSVDGKPLERLEGTIDMGSLAGHVLEPADPRFETTLRVLTHEMLHRWGAYIRFSDAGIESDALLGLDKAHWSFLHDSAGSTLYGNRWQDNGDGTYTAMTPESAHFGELFGRLLNPLELYLMGLAGAEQVPPLKLIDAPGLDPAQLPAPGVTIPGMMRTVSIEEIIAQEGPRIPVVSESRKNLRMGFILALVPGSFNPGASDGVHALTAIGRLRGEWEKRFAILTDGRGSIHTGLLKDLPLDGNPSVPSGTGTTATTASIGAGVDWLVDQQFADGRWQDQPGTALRDTAAALRALAFFPSAAAAVDRGRTWLMQEPAANHDFNARQLGVHLLGGSERLLAEVNSDGGWGAKDGFLSTPLDTALVLQALTARGITGPPVAAACSYLHGSQQADGGWHSGSGPSQLQATCAALQALDPLRAVAPLEATVAEGENWLLSARNGDGGFGRPVSNAAETAQALLTLKTIGTQPAAILPAVQWLLERQLVDGNWPGGSYVTAQVLQALYASQMAPDLALSGADIDFDPPLLTAIPGEVSVTVTVHNLGSEPVTEVSVSLYAGGFDTEGVLLAEQQVAVAGNASTQAIFVVPVTNAGVHSFYVVVDGDRKVTESNEWNNIGSKSLTADLPPPTVAFAAAASSVAEGGGQLALPVVLSHPWHEAITVHYATMAEGSAVAGVDYQPLPGILTISPGATVAEITLQLVDDLLAEADKALEMVLVSLSAGTVGQAQHRVSILDDEPPALLVLSPQPAKIGSSTPLLLFNTTAWSAQVSVDGLPVDTRSGEMLGPLADGVHQLEITAINRLGMSSRQSVDFTIDTSLPTIAVQSPVPGASNEPAPVLLYSVDGASGYALTLDGQALHKNSGERLDPLGDGAHVLSMTAWNASGAQVSTQVRFSVDTRPPEVSILYPNDDLLRETAPRLFCTVGEAVATTVRLDGTVLASGCGERFGPVNDGAHRLQVTAVDSVGNQTVASADFIVSTAAETAYPAAAGWPRQAGKFYGGLAVDRQGSVYLATQDEGYSLTIQKYTDQGVLLWQQRPFAVTLIPRDMAVDADGNLFVVGYNSYGDGFLYKFASVDGRHLAGYSFATAGSDYAYAVQIDSDGQFVVAGETGGGLFGYPNGTMNIWIARLDNNCVLLEGRQLTLGGMQELAGRGSLALDQDGHAYLAGYTDTAAFGPGLGRDDAFVIKFSRSLWPVAPLLQFGTSGDDRAMDVTVDVYGNIYVGGVSVETSYYFEKGFLYKFDAAGNLLKQLVVGTQPVAGLICERDGTLYVLNGSGALGKYDSDLNLLWNRGLGWDYRYQLAKDPFGDLYAAGDGGTMGAYASVIKLFDGRRPEVAVDAGQLQTNRSTVTLGGAVTSGATVELVNPELSLAAPVTYPQAGRWRMEVAGLQEGVTTVVLQAIASNGFSRRIQAMVTVDVTPPQVVITTPADAQFCTEKPPLVYSVSDGEVEVLVNGVALYKASGQLLESLRPGWNTVRVQATDPAGNVGFSVVKIFAEGAAVGEIPLSQATVAQAGTAGDETVVKVNRDSAGNIYLMGYTTGSFPGYVNGGGRDPYISKFDPAGRYLATWQLGSPFDESGGDFAVDGSGNLLVTWNVRRYSNKGQVDFAVSLVKLSGSGVLLWQTELNSSANDQANAVVLTANGEILVAGETYGSLDKQRYGGGGDYFLAKFSASGSKQWVRLSNAADNEAIHALAVDASGAIFGAAHVGSALAGVPVPGHVALLKFDAAGTLLKVEPLTLPGGDFVARALLRDTDGRLLTAGASGSRYFLAAHDLNLSRQWLEVSPATEMLVLSALTVDPTGNLYAGGRVAGAFAGNRAFGGSDVVVIKHSPAGTRQWSQQYGGPGNDHVAGVVWGAAGELWLGGHTDGLLGESRFGQSDPYLTRLTQPQPRFGPVLSIDSHPRLINTTDLQLSGATSPEAVVEIVAGLHGVPFTVPVDGYGRWSASVAGLEPDAENLLTISAGNELGTTSMVVTISVDTVPPQLTVNPQGNPVYEPSLGISGSVEPGAVLTLDFLSTRMTIEVVNGTWNHQTSGLQAGDNLLTFMATDPAGNCTTYELVIRYMPPPPPTLAIAPAMIGTLEAADVVLSVGEVTPPGATVTITRLLDLNHNGHVDSDEPVVSRFTVTDGIQANRPGVPGDSDGSSDGRITVRLNGHFVKDRFHAPGEYLYVATYGRESTSTGFTVIAETRPQSISGTVRNQDGTPVAGALIELTDSWEHSFGFAYSDQYGRYRFDVDSTGDYLLWPAARGQVALRSSQAVLHLAAGVNATRDLTLLSGTHNVSGTVYDPVSSKNLPGITLRAISDDYHASAMTDATGGYFFVLPAGNYRLSLSGAHGDGLAESGYLAGSSAPASLTVAADVAGVNLPVARATASVCGRVRTSVDTPVAGMPVEASHSTSGNFSQSISDGDGRYCVGIDGSNSWTLGHPERLVFASGWVGTRGRSTGAGDADLTVYRLDARMKGVITGVGGQPVAGIPVTVSHAIGPVMTGTTSVAGSYLFGLASEPAGPWNLLVDGQGLGYLPVTEMLLVEPGAVINKDVSLQYNTPDNTIVVTRASYDPRKKILTVEATSNHADAQLQVEGFGAMSYVRLFKGKYYWSLTRSVAERPVSVTVFGAEGRRTAPVL